MKKYKMNTTRPEFLLQLMAEGIVDNLSVDAMKRVLYESNHVSYCVYTAIMESDISLDDITFADTDGETVVIHFKKKSIAKRVKEECNKDYIKYGTKVYQVHLKVRDDYLYGTVTFDHELTFNDAEIDESLESIED